MMAAVFGAVIILLEGGTWTRARDKDSMLSKYFEFNFFLSFLFEVIEEKLSPILEFL
jgi:hypothetical protein